MSIPMAMNPMGGQRDSYKRKLAYLESTGVQWIDTGIVPNVNVGCESSFISTITSTTSSIPGFICGIGSDVWRWGGILFITNSITIQGNDGVQISGIMAYGTTWETYQANRDIAHIVRFNVNADKKAYIDGVLVRSDIPTGDIITSGTIYAFCGNYSTSPSSYGSTWRFFTGRVFYLKLYDNNSLVRDFIPVLDFNDVPCMYDQVTEQLFYNQGTGQFLYG